MPFRIPGPERSRTRVAKEGSGGEMACSRSGQATAPVASRELWKCRESQARTTVGWNAAQGLGLACEGGEQGVEAN